jgi:hypothetical protein
LRHSSLVLREAVGGNACRYVCAYLQVLIQYPKNGYQRGGLISAISQARSTEKLASLIKRQWVAGISRINLSLARLCHFKADEIVILGGLF